MRIMDRHRLHVSPHSVAGNFRQVAAEPVPILKSRIRNSEAVDNVDDDINRDIDEA